MNYLTLLLTCPFDPSFSAFLFALVQPNLVDPGASDDQALNPPPKSALICARGHGGPAPASEADADLGRGGRDPPPEAPKAANLPQHPPEPLRAPPAALGALHQAGDLSVVREAVEGLQAMRQQLEALDVPWVTTEVLGISRNLNRCPNFQSLIQGFVGWI